MKAIALTEVALTTALLGPASGTDDHTVASMPRVVIATVPVAGATDVIPI